MGRQQWQLLVCSATAIALLACSLFVLAWFRMDLMGSVIEVDLHSASLCRPDGVCASVSLSQLKGLYPATSTVAFFTGLLLLLVVVIQCASKLVTGVAHDRVTRIGYLFAIFSILCGFAAGYLFGPEGNQMAGAIASVTVERTWAPLAFLVGSLASLGALYFATVEIVVDNSAEYKPVRLDTRRLPVTPISGVHRVPTPPRAVIPDSLPLDGPVVRRTPTNNEMQRTRPPTNNELLRTRPPSSTPPFGGRSMTPGSGVARTDAHGRSLTPSGGLRSEDLRSKTSSSSPPFGGRSMTPGSSFARTEDTRNKTNPGSSFGREDSRSRTNPGSFARTEDTRSKTNPGSFARVEDTRTKSPTQQPLIARTTSPSGIADPTRTKSPSQPPFDPVTRSRTSSSGPIDMSARLNASMPNVFEQAVAHGSPLEVSIRPPLPSRDPVPADQIPIDPSAGLTIRKRTSSSAPLSENQLPPVPEVRIRKSSSAVEPLPLPPPRLEALTDAAFSPPAESESPTRARRSSAAPREPASNDDSMPQIAIEGLDDLAQALKAASELPAPTTSVVVLPAATSALAAALPVEARDAIAAPTTGAIPMPIAATKSEPHALPDYVRGKIKFAALTVELASGGLKARREDGLEKLVEWGDIVGVVARRLPADKPFESATVVDLISTAGATVRIVPWTRIEGHKFERSPVERARSFVNVVAAMALEAKLDSATKKFAEGTANATQLPDIAALANYDDKLG